MDFRFTHNEFDVPTGFVSSVAPEVGVVDFCPSFIFARQIGLLTHLTHLDLHSNALAVIATEINLLTALQTLHVGWNHYTALPPLGNLTSLITLGASDSNLATLPDLSANSNLRNL